MSGERTTEQLRAILTRVDRHARAHARDTGTVPAWLHQARMAVGERLAHREVRVTYGPPERFYDTDNHTTCMVKKRCETWTRNGKKFGRWEYVPADQSEADATKVAA